MSRHIIHILRERSYLKKEHGFLVCHSEGQEPKRTPIKDIRALVLAVQGMTLSAPLIRSLLESKAVILHCSKSFQPQGFTVGISDVIDKRASFGQVRTEKDFRNAVWHRLLYAKISNQINLLKSLGGSPPLLDEKLKEKPLNESICARMYFKSFFGHFTRERLRRRGDQKHPINKKLNYGYAVLSALCHRSIVVHGLLPQFGIHHMSRYRSHPLVYDLMECLRPFVDSFLVSFAKRLDVTNALGKVDFSPEFVLSRWAQLCAQELYRKHIWGGDGKIALVHAIDVYVRSLALAFAEQDLDKLWLPRLEEKESLNLEEEEAEEKRAI